MHGFCFGPFALGCKRQTQLGQRVQRLRILISRPFAPQGQRFTMHGFRFHPFAFAFKRRTQIAERIQRLRSLALPPFAPQGH